MFQITIPDYCTSEFSYIVNVLFKDFLGLNFTLKNHAKKSVIITYLKDLKKIELEDSFFCNANTRWLHKETLPQAPLKKLIFSKLDSNYVTLESSLPLLFGEPHVCIEEHQIITSVDIFGSSFYMLSRYEECVIYERDSRGRFSFHNATEAAKQLVERPIVDEYVHLLAFFISKLWPTVQLDNLTKSNKSITCDVDWPTDPRLVSLSMTLKSTLSLLHNRKGVFNSFQPLINYTKKKLKLKVLDPYYENVKWIMDVNEKVGNKVTFYFIPTMTHALDSNVAYNSDLISSLLRDIHTRGHTIGIHPGYACYADEIVFRNSVKSMKKILSIIGIPSENLGCRMHFLRWDSAITPSLAASLKLSYDSSLMYAEKSGFRCGTSKTYQLYDVKKRCTLKIFEKPLLLMDGTVLSKQYEGIENNDMAFEKFKAIYEKVVFYGGSYTVLWHNSFLNTSKEKKLYLKVVRL